MNTIVAKADRRWPRHRGTSQLPDPVVLDRWCTKLGEDPSADRRLQMTLFCRELQNAVDGYSSAVGSRTKRRLQAGASSSDGSPWNPSAMVGGPCGSVPGRMPVCRRTTWSSVENRKGVGACTVAASDLSTTRHAVPRETSSHVHTCVRDMRYTTVAWNVLSDWQGCFQQGCRTALFGGLTYGLRIAEALRILGA